MKIEIRLRIDAGDGEACDEEVLVLDKPHDWTCHAFVPL